MPCAKFVLLIFMLSNSPRIYLVVSMMLRLDNINQVLLLIRAFIRIQINRQNIELDRSQRSFRLSLYFLKLNPEFSGDLLK
ncbi:hypothetical protein PSYAE_24972 [Pseudomonas amygdali pv. aesculi str. 0893_23]|nr:hypothetical protein PSYAE_24972 [Pseudomonas amygdali pv. aesculi str. 0893_23]